MYHVVPNTCAVRECKGLSAHLLVLKRGPNHNLLLLLIVLMVLNKLNVSLQ